MKAGLFFIALFLLAGTANAAEEWPNGYVENIEPFDRETLTNFQIEIYRRRPDSDVWYHAYVPGTDDKATYNDEPPPHCFKIRAVDMDRVPLSEFSEESCVLMFDPPSQPEELEIEEA